MTVLVRERTKGKADLSQYFMFSGGCDGCLNVNNADNAGLADIVASLDTVYTDNGYASVLSRADFWALAGIYAVDKSIDLNNADCEEDDCEVPDSGLVFQWGRVDCDTAPYTDVDVGLPSAKLDHANVGKNIKSSIIHMLLFRL